MFKKLIAAALIIMSLFALTIPASMAASDPCDRYSVPFTMYVRTANGGTLNVRNVPRLAEKSIIGHLEYGTAVTVLGVSKANADWVQIRYSKAKSGTAWVMIDFLSLNAPSDADIAQAKIHRQEMRQKSVKNSFTVEARPSRTDGWVNFRTAPRSSASRITTLKLGQRLTVIGQTADWYKAIDSVTGRTGYVSKSFVKKV